MRFDNVFAALVACVLLSMGLRVETSLSLLPCLGQRSPNISEPLNMGSDSMLPIIISNLWIGASYLFQKGLKINSHNQFNLFVFPGEFFDVREFAHIHIRLDLNRSLTMVVDVCQYVHKVSAASRENPQQMEQATKLFCNERS